MSLFTNILEKLGLKKDQAAKTTVKPMPGGSTVKPMPGGSTVKPMPGTWKPGAIAVVDVMKKLEDMAKSKPGLDWKVSIVDLLKLLDLDSSFNARKELATELGCPANLMADSASMNVWLHKTVLQKIADNGGNIPASLLNK